MTSRRPMTRSFSGNGRTSSFSEEEGSSSNGRTESRNPYLSSVRPENSYSRYSHYRPPRSTLCSVMAQLTEDIQPCFETTLKSKAVSENCNVRFTCVVTGYPAPELKWYKDDMELDRYCGLPKYEIRRNGKNHTLHIYNCTLDDAAIYQVSASNTKGIVSCSGVLEVGTMNEFQIHQRFFAKLKEKAEKKKKDVEDPTKKPDKEAPERPPRKRHVPPPEEKPAVKENVAVEQLGAAAEPNGVSSEVKEAAPATSKDLEKEISPSEETLAKKKIKITNGIDGDVDSSRRISRSHMMGNGGENGYDGGLGLAQFLAETIQSQAAEEKQHSPRGERPNDIDVHIESASIEKEREQERMRKVREEQEKSLKEEYEREKRREEELELDMEREKERLNMSHTVPYTRHGLGVKHHGKAHKDHEHHNIQASISSVLHTVKDFFFGKGKKDSHDHTESNERGCDPSPASTPPSFRLQPEPYQVCKPLTEDVVPMEIDKPKEPSETAGIEQKSMSLKAHGHKHEESVLHTDVPPANTLPPESGEESAGQSVKALDCAVEAVEAMEAVEAVEAVEASVGRESSSPGEDMSLSGPRVLPEAEEKDSQIASVIKEDPVHQQEPDCLVVSPQPNHQAARDESSSLPPREEIAVLLQTQAGDKEGCSTTSTLTSLEESWTSPQTLISASNSHSLGGEPTETLQEEKMNVDKSGEEGEPDTEEGHPSDELCLEEKVEVKSNEQPCSDTNRSEITEVTAFSPEERIEPCRSKTPDHVLPSLPAVAAYNMERDHVKEQTKCTSLMQEMNVGFPPTAARESVEAGDPKIQQEESTEGHNVNAIESSNMGFRRDEAGKLKEVFITCNNLEAQESENTDVRNESLPFNVETEKRNPVKVEALAEPESTSGTQNKNNVYVLEEQGNIAHQGSREGQQVRPSANIPEIQISTVEDTLDVTTSVAGVNPNEHFIIPKIEIVEPELKECNLPLTMLALDEEESEPALQKHDATHVHEVTIQNHNLANSPNVLPTHENMQSDDCVSVAEKVGEVAQSGDETKMFEPGVKSGEQLPQMDYASIPVINVLCTDDKEEDSVNTHVSDTQNPFETPAVPLFVVPPISVTCHESDSGLSSPTQSEWTDTQRGTKHDANGINTAASEKTESKKENLEETMGSLKENTPFMLYETPIPKVEDSISFGKTREENGVPEALKTKPLKEAKLENPVSVEDLKRNRSSVERLCSKPPAHPSLSPASLRKFMSKASPDSELQNDEDLSGGSTPTSSLSCESSPRLKRRDSLSLIRSATPEELASGARRKIFIPKPKEDGEGAAVGAPDAQNKKESPYMSPSQARRAALLQAPTGQSTPPMERRSPLVSRRKATLEVPKLVEEPPAEEPVGTKQEEKPAEKKPDPLKAPQVIRKIRGEPFPDASGHLKLWCQFFNVLSDSTIKWYRDEEEILEVKRSGGDESQVALAVVLAASHDCGVYGCSINNEYGTDTTDFLLSEDILSGILLKEDLEVGEEIEMTPLLFNKGLADCGSWGEKYFGRIMTETVRIGEGYAHKASRVKVIYGLDPIFESGSACIIKVQSPIAYGSTKENNLTERNLQITKQECKVQDMIREYCKIFAAEARVIENFGSSLEVIPQYLMYRPANSVPYATVEAHLEGVFLNYCTMEPKGKLITRTVSEVEQKCCTFQHWLHQWTHGNLLVTRLEGVETKITNVRVVTKSKGYQGLTERGSPEVFEQFLTHHQCNYYCGLLGLRPLKTADSLQPTKIKGSRSPLLNRKVGSNSPQLQRKGHSPQMSRKANSSPKVTRKIQEAEDNKSDAKPKPAETVDVLETSYQNQQGLEK